MFCRKSQYLLFVMGGFGTDLLAFIAGRTVFQASAWTETVKDFLVARRVGQMIGILEDESVCGVMMILGAHKTIDAQREILTRIAHNVRDNVRFH
jgi:hypothetical protein